jgi:hypothetical protein
VFIALIIYEFIRPGDEHAIKIIVFSLFVVLWPVFYMPYFQDAIEQETTTIIVEYVHHNKGHLPVHKYVFVGDMGKIELFAPKSTFPVTNLELGKSYEIEYYKHSKLIKEYKLIE